MYVRFSLGVVLAAVNKFTQPLANAALLFGGFFLLLSSMFVQASDLQVQRFAKSEEGYKLDSINDVIQDRKGFLWLAAEVGLLRFDGSRIQRWGTGSGVDTSELAWDLEEDHRGHLWIATDYGLRKFDPASHTFTAYLHQPDNANSINHNYVSAVIESRDHQIYAATLGGIAILSSSRDTIRRLQASKGGLASNLVRGLFEDRDGYIWIGYQDAGISRFDPRDNSFIHFKHQPGVVNSLAHNDVRTFVQDALGRIWVGTWGGGVSRLNSDAKTFTNFLPGTQFGQLRGGIVNDIYSDSRGNTWVAIDKGGVYRFNNETQLFQQYVHDSFDERSLLSSNVRRVLEDRSGDVWFMTFPGGLNRYHPVTDQIKRWQKEINNPNSLSDSSILSLLRSRDGYLWVGTENGLNQVDEASGEIVHYLHSSIDKNSIPADAVTALAETPDGAIWIGTWSGGLARFDRVKNQFTRYQDGSNDSQFSGANIWKLFVDSDGTLWIGTESAGLYRYNSGTDSFHVYNVDETDENSLSSNYVLDIVEDLDGSFWIGTQRGLNHFYPNTGQFERIDFSNSLGVSTQRVKSILLGPDNTIWLATQSSGLIRWVKGGNDVRRITQLDGLPANGLSALQFDQRGDVWLSSHAGIAKVNAETARVETLLTKQLGLAGEISNRLTTLKNNDGSLYFGSTEGLSKFNPTTLRLPDGEPILEFTDLSVLGESVAVAEQGSPLTRAVSETETVSFADSAKLISFEFANLNYSFANESKIFYRMKGVDQDWRSSIGNSSVKYANLSPGHYTFELKARNHFGDWSPNIRSLDVRVLPPLWRSNVAYAIYLIVLILLAYLFSRLVFLRYINAKLNRQVASRTEELLEANAAKSRFLANVSHELRTPLNSINGFSKRALNKYRDSGDSQLLNALDTIHRNGIHLNNVINDILDLSKIEAGKMDVNLELCQLTKLLSDCINDHHVAAEKKGLRLEWAGECPVATLTADVQRLTQIMHNLLSNAIKYTDSGVISVSVALELYEDQYHCAIKVADTGKGISPESQERLFRRFEQVDDSTRYIQGFGTGLGLALVDEFVRLHRGRVICESAVGKGSTFTVLIPI
ncbi:ligand-binding sensor domain-containing protein [Teredinibacter waterburyi]|uniref:ligand-binding sensor domain-containing protein n=1 Tax=Teredinibacter waterburyi TaxID=1500538 RepID=UPI00165EF8F6|nr:sensor histidine kinase [Teredinibacter waterburyi]